MRENLPNLRGPEVSERVNNAYLTYCSMYLDFYDDNMRHLYDRGNDTYPIDKIDHDPTEQELYDTYKEACIDFAATTLSSYDKSERDQKFQEWFEKDYPLINEWKDEVGSSIAKIKIKEAMASAEGIEDSEAQTDLSKD